MTIGAKGNYNSPDGAKSSLDYGNWSPHGYLYYTTQKGGLVSLAYWNFSQLHEATNFAKQRGWSPLNARQALVEIHEAIDTLDKRLAALMASRDTPRPDQCGDCGNTHLTLDHYGRGWFCTKELDMGGNCGWQSWR